MNHIFLLTFQSIIQFSLIDKLTADFLFFSWQALNKNILITKQLNCPYVVRPPSRAWFLKVSSLIRCGRIFYDKFIFNVHSDSSLRCLRASIIQNSIFLIVKPFFDEYLFFNTSYFSEYFALS